MDNLLLPSSNNDIYSTGFDQSLNRNDTPLVLDDSTPTADTGYSSVDGVITQSFDYGVQAVGSNSSFVVIDPSKGMYVGATSFANAPFRVNMNGEMFASTGVFSGSLSGNSINIPNSTNPLFSVDSSGNTTLRSYRLITQLTAGESVSTGKLLCFKNTQVSWGDDVTANRQTTAIMTAFTYVDGGNVNTNEGASPTQVKIGATGGGQSYYVYGKIDTSNSSPPGLPAWNEIDTIYLRLYVVFADSNAQTPLVVNALNASFSETTVTWNNKPADDGIVWATARTASAFSTENMASTNDMKNTGYLEWDITELYRLWSQGAKTNNGFVIKSGSSNPTNAVFGGRLRSGGGTYNQAPFVISYITKDNPGAGNTMTANDGKVYLASNNDYQRVKSIAGICGTTASSGATVDVYALADKSIIPTSILSVTNNSEYYLMDTAGTIGKLTNDIIESNKWDIKVGTGTPNGLSVDLERKPLFIKSYNWVADVFPPPHATMAIVQATKTTGVPKVFQAVMTVSKPFFTTSNWEACDNGGTQVSMSVSWGSGTSGLLDVGGTDTVNGQTVIYWYR